MTYIGGMATKVAKAAAIYARISKDRAGDMAGVGRQVKDCRALAERLGWTVSAVYVDDDVSAYSGRKRPAYERMLRAIEAREHDGLLVYHLDRLHRQAREQEAFFDLCIAAGVMHWKTVHSDFDLGNDDSMFTARILAAVATKESADKSRRIRRKLQENALEGKPHGARLGYGYTDSGKIDRAQAKVIRDMAAAFDAGESLTSLARRLNDTGVRTPSDGEWTLNRVRSILGSARISGRREHLGEVVATAQWPAIISAELSDRIRARLSDPARKERRAPRRRLLAHLLRCGVCGNKLTAGVANSAGESRPVYRCRRQPGHAGCGRISINAANVEQLIAQAVLMRLDSPELATVRAGNGTGDEVRQALEDALLSDGRQLEELAAAYGANQISLKEWMIARKPIEARLQDTRRQLAHQGGDPVLASLPVGGSLRKEFAAMNLSRQAAIIEAVLDHAVIHPGKRSRTFDVNRVEPHWRV